MSFTASAGCGQPGHVRVVTVDGQNWLYSECRYRFSGRWMTHDNATVLGQVEPEDAAAIRRAEQAWKEGGAGALASLRSSMGLAQ